VKLDLEEADLLARYEAGEFESVASAAEISRFREAARATAIKDKRINIRLSSADLQALRARALTEGVPYQTLIASVLHKYATGQLREPSSARKRPRSPRRELSPQRLG
jgi:predicted DNA binding CopG/RHH family protein